MAQDPTTVGQGIKTVSLRLRSTKTELEEMGEDAEGAAENVSKLREQMLALTGVDIQLDDDTYKSTYQILLEISKVWGRLSDLSRSSVLEQLFGKRQANIGAAILENGDLLERVYKTSERASDGIGSAMREQEEYAKSIQYSIGTLKAAYQDFADSVINSDFVKNLLGTAQSFLEVLTKIIDKFGTLPTILTGIAAVGGFKNIGLFGNLETGLTSVTTKFETLKQVLSYDFGGLYKKFNINLSGISDSEVQSLQNYIDALNRGTKPAEAMKDIMAETSEAAQQQATQFTYLYQSYQRGEVSANQYKTATQNLALTQKTATATSKALSIALNTIANIGIMVAINLAIKGISALVDKLIVTKEELAEFRSDALEDIQELSDGIEELVDKKGAVQDLLDEYSKLISTSQDVSQNKDKLLEIQDAIVKNLDAERNSLDLLNDTYDVTIGKVKALTDAQYSRWEMENASKIAKYEAILGMNINDETTRNGGEFTNTEGLTEQLREIKSSLKDRDLAKSLFYIEGLTKEARRAAEAIDGIYISGVHLGEGKDKITLSGDIYEAYSQLEKLIQSLKDSGASWESLEPLTDRFTELGTLIQDIDNYTQVKAAHDAAYIEGVGDAVVDETNAIKTASGELRKEFYENLDELQKGALADIDKIKSAMQSLAEGNKLSSSDFWAIAELDKDRILSDIQSINGEFTVSIESLMNLKDSYIKEQIKAYEDKISQIKADHKDELAEIQDYASEISQLENEITEKSIDINQTVFGNIDTNSRQILEWTDENLEKYKDAIESWGATTDDLAGSISTVFGTYGEFDGVDIAFSPILQTQDGAVLLTEQTVNKYIFGLIEKAGEGWTNEDLLRLDTRGLEIDGVKIKNLIADIGATAAKTSEAMHYVGNSGALSRAQTSYSKINDSAKDYLGTIKDCNLMIEYLNSLLGNTVDKQKAIEEQQKKLNEEIKKAQDYADNLLKAQEYKIDQIIDGHQRELDSLNAEKEVLQDELDALNDQKDAIEDIIKNYESVNSLVQDTVQKEIDSLNEQKKAIEDTYNKRIEALKTENEEREDALEYAQKLANLENAKNNKVRVIDATRGFRYESVKEDVAKAQSDLDSFENAQAIKALEKARDAETKVIDDVIEEKEKYSKSWADILDTIKTDEDELLAAEILGADWREKIAQGDTELMEKFRTEYLKHNTNLKMLTNTEIKLKETAIKAKDEEINAKNEQIKKWKEYKTEVQNAAKEIKDANDGYLSQLSTVELDETSSLERRQANLDAFKTAYTNALSTVVDLQNQLGGGDYYYTMHVENTDELEKAANEAAKLAAASAATYAMADEVKKRQVQNAGEEIAQVGEDIIKRISGLFGFSEGGVADYTGLAMLHGRKNAPETIFNANDSAKLYEMVHNTPNLMANMIDKATKISGFNLANASNNTQNSNEYSFYIDKIVTDDPQDFAKQLDRYYQTKLTKSYTNK